MTSSLLDLPNVTDEVAVTPTSAVALQLQPHVLAAVLVAVIGGIGLIANFFAIWIVAKIRILRNCFGYLCLIHAAAEAGVLLILVFWAVPMIFVNNGEIAHGFFGRKVGHLCLWFYYVTLYVQLCKVCNRFVAIASPVVYRKYFGEAQALYLFIFVVVCACLHCIVYFFDGCDFYYEPITLIWTFASTPCGNVLAFYIDFVYGCSFMTVVMCIDVCTFSLIFLTRAKIKQNTTTRSRDIRFFVQACTTSVLYSLMLASFHLTWRITDDPWIGFLSTTLAWTLCHTLDGVCMIAFNAKFREQASLIGSSKGSFAQKSTMGSRVHPQSKTI